MRKWLLIASGVFSFIVAPLLYMVISFKQQISANETLLRELLARQEHAPSASAVNAMQDDLQTLRTEIKALQNLLTFATLAQDAKQAAALSRTDDTDDSPAAIAAPPPQEQAATGPAPVEQIIQQYAAEKTDVDWAAEVSSKLTDAFISDSNLMEGTLLDVDCRSSICQIDTLVYPDTLVDDRFAFDNSLLINFMQAGLSSGYTTNEQRPDGSVQITYYALRQNPANAPPERQRHTAPNR